MLPTTHAYSSFAVKDVPSAKRFYGDTLGIKLDELYGGEMLELHLDGDKHVMVYAKEDFTPATYTVLNFPVPSVEAAVDELNRKGVRMEQYEGFDQDAKGISHDDRGPTIAWFRDPDGNILAVHSEEQPPA
jgi:predicted enzyme related to lactoylglutathione lyase